MKTNETNQTLKQIEEKRAAFVPYYYKQDKIEKIIFAIGIIIMAFGWLALPAIWKNGGKAMQAVQLITMLVPALSLIVYALIMKKAVNKRANDYFKTFYRNTNLYVFDQPGCNNLIFQEPSTIAKEKFDENLLFSNVTKLNSKGYSTFEYKKLPIEIADVAAITGSGKSMAVAFTGKYLTSKAKYFGKDRVVIYLKGEGLVLPPTNVEGLSSVLDNKQMTIWSNSKDWKKIVPAKVLKLIESIKTNELLIDFSITIHSGKQYVCMGYNDPLMLPAFEKEYDPKPTEQYKKEVAIVLSIMEALA